jgi:hypothetical protein
MRTRNPPIVGEFDCSDLGDERLEARLALLAETLAHDPKLSFPEALGDDAELEAAYRFFNNPRVDADAILYPHITASAARLAGHQRVLAVHDTTEFVFGGRSKRRGLEGDRFHAHFSLAVSADGRREPLGLLGVRPWVRGETKTVRDTKARRHDEDRESKRWLAQSLAVEAAVGDVVLIHVEDREADIFESLSARTTLGMHFIVRAQSQRSIDVDGARTNILDHLRSQERRFERAVTLSRRQVSTAPKNTYQDRAGRKARLAIAATRVVIKPPRADQGKVVEPLAVNAVHIIEVDPPDGEEAVEWLLLTTEPIATEDDMAFVVDSYRARWVIEEYFKALKTGCAYEARQLESYDALLRALSVFAVIAWRLLWMRFLHHHAPKTAATAIATKAELDVLEAQDRLGREPTVGDFLMAVANLGGHLKRNGPAGWQVLWRGYRSLRLLAAGFALAKRSDQW